LDIQKAFTTEAQRTQRTKDENLKDEG